MPNRRLARTGRRSIGPHSRLTHCFRQRYGVRRPDAVKGIVNDGRKKRDTGNTGTESSPGRGTAGHDLRPVRHID